MPGAAQTIGTALPPSRRSLQIWRSRPAPNLKEFPPVIRPPSSSRLLCPSLSSFVKALPTTYGCVAPSFRSGHEHRRGIDHGFLWFERSCTPAHFDHGRELDFSRFQRNEMRHFDSALKSARSSQSVQQNRKFLTRFSRWLPIIASSIKIRTHPNLLGDSIIAPRTTGVPGTRTPRSLVFFRNSDQR